MLQYGFTWHQLSAVAGVTFWRFYFNPTEYLWAHWKHQELPNFCPEGFAELSTFARTKPKRSQRPHPERSRLASLMLLR